MTFVIKANGWQAEHDVVFTQTLSGSSTM